MRRLEPYVYAPLGVHYRPRGRLRMALAAEIDSDAQAVRKVRLSRTIGVDKEAWVPVGGGDPFMSASRVAVEIKDADLLDRTLTVASARIEGLELQARRDAHGVVDVVEMFRGPAAGDPGGAARAPARAGAGARRALGRARPAASRTSTP